MPFYGQSIVDILQFDLDKANQEVEQLQILEYQLLHNELGDSWMTVSTDHTLPIAPKLRNPALKDASILRNAETKIDKIYRATDKNVELQERTAGYGSQWQYRLHCSRCKTSDEIQDPKKFFTEEVSDNLVVFCIKHRHDGQNNAMRVMQIFSDKQDASIPEGGRMFREDDE